MRASKNVRPLFINRSEMGGGAEQFTADLVRNTDHARWIVENGHQKKLSSPMPDTALTRLTGFMDKAVRKASRFRGLHQMLGLHDEGHQTMRRLHQSPEYLSSSLVHLNNIHGGWFDLYALKGIDTEKPVVWTLHDMWCMTGGEAYVFDDEGYTRGEWSTPFNKFYPLNAPLLDRRKHYLESKKTIYPQLRQTVFVPVSKWLEKCLRSAYVYHQDMRIQVIKNGVDVNFFRPAHKKGTSLKKRVLFFNNPSPFKGSEMGVEVLKGLGNQAEVMVVGAKAPQIPNARHVSDFITDRGKLRELLNEADLLLFPSRAENMPLTILEAMACGTPAVMAAVGGIPEIVIDGETGFLASEAKVSSLKEKLEEALATDLSLTSACARDFVCAYHNYNDMLDSYRELYESLVP